MRIRNKLLLVMVGALLLVTSGFTLLLYSIQRHQSEARIDGELRMLALMAREVLPAGYHDNIQNKDSVSDAQYYEIVDQFNRLCLEENLEYLWSLMLIDGKIVFTSATSPSKDVTKKDHARFFEVHSNPELYTNAFQTMKPQFQVNQDKWGRIRAVLVPLYDSHGRPYLIGASRSMQKVERELRATLYSSLGLAVGTLILGVLSSLVLANSISRPIEEVSKHAMALADGNLAACAPVRGATEIELLGASMAKMSKAISGRLQDLKASEEKYRKLMETANDPIFLAEADTAKLVDANLKAQRLIGRSLEEIRQMHAFELHPPEDKDLCQRLFREHVQDGRAVTVDLFVVHCDGERIPVEVSASTFEVNGKRLVQGMFRDVTERKKSDQALRESEGRYRSLLEAAPASILVVQNDVFVYCNPFAARNLGYESPDELVGLSFWETVSNESRQTVKTRMENLHFGKENSSVEVRVLDKKGAMRWIESTSLPILFQNNPAALIISIDITERKQAEMERELLERKLIQISDREQSRLGRDLHDDLGQQLVGVRLMLEALEQRLKTDKQSAANIARQTVGLVHQAILTARNLAKGLYPVDLSRNGLMASLVDLVSRTAEISGVRCVVRQNKSFQCDPGASIHLYRIVQEALSNALQHGKPRCVIVQCTVIKGVSTVRVLNDGFPFASPKRTRTGMGLDIFRYRAQMIGAEITVRGARKGGCIVTCVLKQDKKRNGAGGDSLSGMEMPGAEAGDSFFVI